MAGPCSSSTKTTWWPFQPSSAKNIFVGNDPEQAKLSKNHRDLSYGWPWIFWGSARLTPPFATQPCHIPWQSGGSSISKHLGKNLLPPFDESLQSAIKPNRWQKLSLEACVIANCQTISTFVCIVHDLSLRRFHRAQSLLGLRISLNNDEIVNMKNVYSSYEIVYWDL